MVLITSIITGALMRLFKQAHQLLSSLQQDPTKGITQLLQQLKVSSSSSSSATEQQDITTLALPTSYGQDPAILHPWLPCIFSYPCSYIPSDCVAESCMVSRELCNYCKTTCTYLLQAPACLQPTNLRGLYTWYKSLVTS